jgi:hypothetical protein
LVAESTGTSFTFKTGDMVYKPLAVRAALIAGFRRALPVFRYMIVVAEAAVMWESPQGFPRGVRRVEAGFLAFHAFHTPAFPRLVFSRKLIFVCLDRRIAATPTHAEKMESFEEMPHTASGLLLIKKVNSHIADHQPRPPPKGTSVRL